MVENSPDFSALSGDWLKEENLSSYAYQDGYYTPIYLEPMVGSGERLCIGVVAATQDSFVVARTPGLERLSCFYDQSADFLLRVIEEVCRDLEVRLESLPWRGIGLGAPLSGLWKSPFEGFFVGQPFWASGKDAGDIADIGLQMCASLVRNRPANEIEKERNLTRTRLLEKVKGIVLSEKRWATWFDAALPQLSSHRFDFLGQRLAAHIGLLPPTDLTPNVYTAKSGVFDLSFLKSRYHDLAWPPLELRRIDRFYLLLLLNKDQVAKNGRQTRAQITADQLTQASENMGVNVYAGYSAEEIADQLIRLEVA